MLSCITPVPDEMVPGEREIRMNDGLPFPDSLFNLRLNRCL